jgi:hypothetical protein
MGGRYRDARQADLIVARVLATSEPRGGEDHAHHQEKLNEWCARPFRSRRRGSGVVHAVKEG